MSLALPETAPPVLSVYSDLCCDCIFALVHEDRDEEVLYGKTTFFFDRTAMVQERESRKGVREERMRPPDAEELPRELMRRIKGFAQQYGATVGRIRFAVVDHGRKKTADRLFLPVSWQNPKAIRKMQEAFDGEKVAVRLGKTALLLIKGEKEFEEGRPRRAVRILRLVAEKNPELALPHLLLGETHTRLGKCDEAKRHFLRSRSLLDEDRSLTAARRESFRIRIDESLEKLSQRPQTVSSPAALPEDAVSIVPSAQDGLDVPVVYSFEPPPEDLLRRYAERRFEPIELHRLRLDAERLRFLEGFDELLAPHRCLIESYEHQTRTARTVVRRMKGRALLCDEVGLGKTIEAGLVLKEYLLRGMVSRVLILTVPALLSQWKEEMAEKFDLPFRTTEDAGHARSPESFWNDEPMVIASLASAKREPHQGLILGREYDLVIVDEAHHLRNRDTQAWKFVSLLKKKFLLLLTATPFQNDLEELYNLVTLLRPGQLGTPADFKKKYLERGDSRKPKNTEALRSLLREVMVRNTRAAADVKLPRRIARTVSIPLSEMELGCYRAVSDLVRALSREKNENHFLLTLLQREAGSSLRAVLPTLRKLEPVVPETLRPLFEKASEAAQQTEEGSKLSTLRRILSLTGEKCLIFTEFRETQAHLVEALKKTGQTPVVLEGSMSPSEKAEAIRLFQERGRLLISTPVGGEGTNLQFCRTLVNYDLPWNPMKIEQRIGRVHRIGQTGEVLIYNLAAQETVEHYMLKILDEKLNLFELVVGEAETILGSLTEERDFEDILMDIWLEATAPGDMDAKIEGFAERILEAKERYLEIKKSGESLFGGDYETV